MSITAGFILTMVIGLLIVVSLIGSVFLSLSMSKTSKKYRELVRGLKKQNQYVEWSKQHARLVLAERVFQYGSVVFLLALFAYVGSVYDFIAVPRLILIVSAILVYLFWPFYFISLLVISRLYRTVPELQS